MMLLDLPWLDDPPADWRRQLKDLLASPTAAQTFAQNVVGCRLLGNSLHQAGIFIGKLVQERSDAIRLGVLCNGTSDLLLPAVSASALRHGVWVDVIGTGFGQVANEALDPASQINASKCHFVLLGLDHRGLPLSPCVGDERQGTENVRMAVQYVDKVRRSLKEFSGCSVIVQTAPQVSGALFGSLERATPGTQQWLIEKYNQDLRACIAGSTDHLLDIAALAENVGLTQWHDPIQWAFGKFPFSAGAIPIYADWVGRLLGAARGKARKCLVLDLDNTLWGGVIGDDGMAGIVLGNGSAAGEGFLAVQRTALALRDRGILLAVSSKNDEAIARSAFRSHPEMLLKEEHIASFQANWRDKAANLRAIAGSLNLGVDALVLLDDSPFERAQVRYELPVVAAPKLPADPSLVSETLLAAGYFESTAFTDDDRRRVTRYQENFARSRLLSATGDLMAYLRALDMKAICRPFDPIDRARVTQLINKTNQFNLTTQRYTEAEVEEFEKSQTGTTLQLRLIDRFGDNGVVAVVICVEQGDAWVIDTWLMSCRVLNRQVEQAALGYIVACAKAAGIRVLRGRYIRTDRNQMVRDHYASLGFEPIDVRPEESLWHLKIESWVPRNTPIQILTRQPSQKPQTSSACP